MVFLKKNGSQSLIVMFFLSIYLNILLICRNISRFLFLQKKGNENEIYMNQIIQILIIVTLNIQYHHHFKILFMRTIRFLCFVAKETEKMVPLWNSLLQSYSHFMLVKSFYLFSNLTNFAANAQFLGKRTYVVAHYTWKD